MWSHSLRALSFASLALMSFGCAAAQSSSARATPKAAIEQASPEQAVAGYVSPTAEATAANVVAASTTSPAPSAAADAPPATESDFILAGGGIRTIFGGNGAPEGASLHVPRRRAGAP